MERKGSGFGKIIDAYEFQVNYTEDKKPYFRSDRAGFVAIMPNLNYDVPQGDPQDVPQDVPQGVPQDVPQGYDLDKWIERQVAVFPNITSEELASQIGVTSKTIKRRIAKMPHIRYVGSGYSGHWEVRKKK